MERFLLFGWTNSPGGGFDDFITSYSTVEEMVAAWKKVAIPYGYQYISISDGTSYGTLQAIDTQPEDGSVWTEIFPF